MGPQERSSHNSQDEVRLRLASRNISTNISHFSSSQKTTHGNQVGSSFSSKNSAVQVTEGVKETVGCQTGAQEGEKLMVREAGKSISSERLPTKRNIPHINEGEVEFRGTIIGLTE